MLDSVGYAAAAREEEEEEKFPASEETRARWAAPAGGSRLTIPTLSSPACGELAARPR